jgi:hypothetical protein
VTQSIKKQEVKHMTDDQRKAAEERERKAREEEERQRAAADKLERKRREAEARMRTQQHPVGGAVPSESNAEANRAAAADVLKFAVADKIKAKMAASAPKKNDDDE